AADDDDVRPDSLRQGIRWRWHTWSGHWRGSRPVRIRSSAHRNQPPCPAAGLDGPRAGMPCEAVHRFTGGKLSPDGGYTAVGDLAVSYDYANAGLPGDCDRRIAGAAAGRAHGNALRRRRGAGDNSRNAD